MPQQAEQTAADWMKDHPEYRPADGFTRAALGPFFFQKVPGRKREVHEDYEGHFITTHTVRLSDGKNERWSVVHLFLKNRKRRRDVGFTLCCGHFSNIKNARKFIDDVKRLSALERIGPGNVKRHFKEAKERQNARKTLQQNEVRHAGAGGHHAVGK